MLKKKYKEFESAFVNRQIGKFINGNKKIIRSGNVTGKIIGTNLGCMMYLLEQNIYLICKIRFY